MRLERQYVQTKMPRISDPDEQAAIVDAAAICMQDEVPMAVLPACLPAMSSKLYRCRTTASLRQGMATLTGYLNL